MPALEWELKSSVKKKRVAYLWNLLYTDLYNLIIVIFSYEVLSGSCALNSESRSDGMSTLYRIGDTF